MTDLAPQAQGGQAARVLVQQRGVEQGADDVVLHLMGGL